ncbi:MAG TPA: hypothetical protein VEC99_00840, partial [Clostridia bacterium]|nr:hypothetical protein [Clostridia bacterium]
PVPVTGRLKTFTNGLAVWLNSAIIITVAEIRQGCCLCCQLQANARVAELADALDSGSSLIP